MEVNYLIFALLNATLGFMVWYLTSKSLRLPKSIQIQFDINKSYFGRILRRRFLGFFLYAVVPLILLFWVKVIDGFHWKDLGINFAWNGKVTLWLAILLPLTLFFNWLSSRGRNSLEEYPEIRVAIWTPWLAFKSAFAWIFYLVGLEFLFRGLVLQSVFGVVDCVFPAVLVGAGLYSMIHYWKLNVITYFSFSYGLILGWATLDCSGSLLPTILVQIIGGLATEWMAIAKHPEIRFQKNLYTTT